MSNDSSSTDVQDTGEEEVRVELTPFELSQVFNSRTILKILEVAGFAEDTALRRGLVAILASQNRKADAVNAVFATAGVKSFILGRDAFNDAYYSEDDPEMMFVDILNQVADAKAATDFSNTVSSFIEAGIEELTDEEVCKMLVDAFFNVYTEFSAKPAESATE